MWSGVLCCGVGWSGVVLGFLWCDVVWCGVLCCSVVWCCGVVWCSLGVVCVEWCGVMWCGVV